MPILEDLKLSSKEYLVATVHRVSNTDSFKNLSSIVNAFCDVDIPIVFPVHPRTRKYLMEYGLWEKLCENVKVIPPVGYLDMLKLEVNSRKILTDSGGVQKEAYLLGVPCITLRENTELVETLEEGWNVLVKADYHYILQAANNFEGNGRRNMLFGDGKTAEKIRNIIIYNKNKIFIEI